MTPAYSKRCDGLCGTGRSVATGVTCFVYRSTALLPYEHHQIYMHVGVFVGNLHDRNRDVAEFAHNDDKGALKTSICRL